MPSGRRSIVGRARPSSTRSFRRTGGRLCGPGRAARCHSSCARIRTPVCSSTATRAGFRFRPTRRELSSATSTHGMDGPRRFALVFRCCSSRLEGTMGRVGIDQRPWNQKSCRNVCGERRRAEMACNYPESRLQPTATCGKRRRHAGTPSRTPQSGGNLPRDALGPPHPGMRGIQESAADGRRHSRRSYVRPARWVAMKSPEHDSRAQGIPEPWQRIAFLTPAVAPSNTSPACPSVRECRRFRACVGGHPT